MAEINMATPGGFDTTRRWVQWNVCVIYLYFLQSLGRPVFSSVIFLLVAKIKFNRKIKSYLLIAIFIESLNTWRDPLEISLKIIVQQQWCFTILSDGLEKL